MLHRLRGELARAGLLEGKTPWLQVAIGSDHLPHVSVLSPSRRYHAIENTLIAHLRKIEGLPRGAHVLFSEARNGREYGILVTANRSLDLRPLLAHFDAIVSRNEEAVDARSQRLVEEAPGYAYYRVRS